MIKIVIVDDSKEYVESLKPIFNASKDDYKLAYCFNLFEHDENIDFMLEKIGKIRPDVVLMDFSFVLANRPNDFGVTLVRRVLSEYPDQKIIMLVGDDDDSDEVRWDKIRRSFAAGAHGYLAKRSIAGWRDAISDVVQGDNYVNEKSTKIYS